MIIQPKVRDRGSYDSELEVLRIGEFVDRPEAEDLLHWAFRMEPYLRSNGPGRVFLRTHTLPEQRLLHAAVADRIRRTVIGDFASTLEPVLTNYLSIISTGGAVHPHIDTAPEGTRHLRCNLFLQVAEAGGHPIIGDAAFNVADRTLLCFFPSSHLHSSMPAGGSRKRVLLSFGFLVPASFRLDAAMDQ